jgi:hypothetical protein
MLMTGRVLWAAQLQQGDFSTFGRYMLSYKGSVCREDGWVGILIAQRRNLHTYSHVYVA